MIRRSGTISDEFGKSLDKLAAAIPELLANGTLEKYVPGPGEGSLGFAEAPGGNWRVAGTKFLVGSEDYPAPSNYALYQWQPHGDRARVLRPIWSGTTIEKAVARAREMTAIDDAARKKQFRDLAIKSLVGEK